MYSPMFSDLVATVRNLTTLNFASIVFFVFLLAAIGILAHKFTRQIDNALFLAGAFALAIGLSSNALQENGGLHQASMFVAALIGVGWSCYLRLCSRRW